MKERGRKGRGRNILGLTLGGRLISTDFAYSLLCLQTSDTKFVKQGQDGPCQGSINRLRMKP